MEYPISDGLNGQNGHHGLNDEKDCIRGDSDAIPGGALQRGQFMNCPYLKKTRLHEPSTAYLHIIPPQAVRHPVSDGLDGLNDEKDCMRGDGDAIPPQSS